MEIGKAEIVQEGDALTLIAWGAMMRPVLTAAEEVHKERGVKIEIIDLLTINPMDTATIIDSVKKTGRCVVAQEAPANLGVASEITARINDGALMYLEAPVNRVTNYDLNVPLFGREMMYYPSTGRIRRAIEETLDF
jgi:pyruvate/2-oxoglutarate/acetoin dehydrogenase E1 component